MELIKIFTGLSVASQALTIGFAGILLFIISVLSGIKAGKFSFLLGKKGKSQSCDNLDQYFICEDRRFLAAKTVRPKNPEDIRSQIMPIAKSLETSSVSQKNLVFDFSECEMINSSGVSAINCILTEVIKSKMGIYITIVGSKTNRKISDGFRGLLRLLNGEAEKISYQDPVK